ncbi:MAG: c-type cytochrome biogenesis protein CcmI [Gammaproteobacteria bacterium]|nr:c-type cytochrome biogenesis protein CcmI [Gammaproteobacteria bacterium]MBA3731763.1 c-type cytochrome biogenesis protein CcmI [Gammaproteobacteria bacterium]
MTGFWIVAGLLIVAALSFVLPPLLNRRGDAADGPTRIEINRALYRQRLAELQRDVDNDLLTQAQYERGRLDLERELLAEVAEDSAPPTRTSRGGAGRTAALVGIAMPVLAVFFYLQFSTGFDALDGSSTLPSVGADSGKQPSIEEIAGVIEARLKQNPEDRTGWIMLARVHTLTGRYAAAHRAFARADALKKINEPDLLAAYAQTLSLAQGQQFAGRPAAMLEQALKIQPENPQALWLAGWADFQARDFARAAERWQTLFENAPGELVDRFVDLPQRIAEARRLAGLPANTADKAKGSSAGKTAGDTEPAAAPPASITVSVNLAPGLGERAAPGDTVFVYAQAIDGPRMPLALARGTAADLPLEVTLDDSTAMAPMFKLSGEDEVNVLARISKSGDAMPQSGDLLGEHAQVGTRENVRVSITIDEIIP